MAVGALSRVNRLQRIQEILLSSPNGHTARELAERLGVNRSIIYRDLAELEEYLPMSKEGARFRIERTKYLSGVQLSQSESLMLYLAMRHMIRRTTHVPPSMISGLEKLSIVLRHPLAAQLAESVTYIQSNKPPDPERAKVWDILTHGWLAEVAVRIEYLKFARTQAHIYELQPYFFEPAVLSDGVYVIGFSQSHNGLRTFKVERILRAVLTTQSFQRPDGIDLDTMLRHAWGIWYGEEPTKVRLRFKYPASRRVCETIWHPLQEIEEFADGSIEWRVQVAGTTELLPWIRGWGPDVEVLEPAELRERIAEEMYRAAMVYRGGLDE